MFKTELNTATEEKEQQEYINQQIITKLRGFCKRRFRCINRRG